MIPPALFTTFEPWTLVVILFRLSHSLWKTVFPSPVMIWGVRWVEMSSEALAIAVASSKLKSYVSECLSHERMVVSYNDRKENCFSKYQNEIPVLKRVQHWQFRSFRTFLTAWYPLTMVLLYLSNVICHHIEERNWNLSHTIMSTHLASLQFGLFTFSSHTFRLFGPWGDLWNLLPLPCLSLPPNAQQLGIYSVINVIF